MTKKEQTFIEKMEDLFQDEFKKVFVGHGNEFEDISPISTGLLSLDTSIGIGGIPRRRYTIIDGPQGSGKTSLALAIAKNALNLGLKVLLVDVENQNSIEYIDEMIGLGHLNNDFVLAKPDNSDNAFKTMEKAIESTEFGLVILDSIGALSPLKEQEKEFDESSVALVPRDMTKFLRRMSYLIRINNIAMVFINQVRAKIGGGPMVRGYDTPGGFALKHYASLIISLGAGQQMKRGGEVVGITSKFVIKKNKLSAPFRSYDIPIIFGEGVDTYRDTVSFAERIGVLKRRGPYYTLDGEVLGSGLVNTMAYIKERPEIYSRIRELSLVMGVSNAKEENQELEAEVVDE